jgi:ceramide glucosyltransferase
MLKMFEIVLALIVAAGLIHLVTAHFIFRLNMRTKITPQTKRPFVTLLKPLKGLDDNLENNLRTFFELDYPEFEILFGIQSRVDEAIPIVKKLQKEYPGISSKLVVSNYQIGLNPKVNNLANMFPEAGGELILINDSNTLVKKDFLTNLVNEYESDEKIETVTATIRGIGAMNKISVWENLQLNNFIAPNIFLSSDLADIQIVVGKAILMSRKALLEIGGFYALRNYLAEDFIIGKKVKDLGYKVKNSTTIVDNFNANISFKKFFNRHTRWAKMRKNIDFPHYIMESIANPIVNSFILAILLQNTLGLVQFLSVVSIKIFVDFLSSRVIKADIKWYQFIHVIPKDFAIFFVWMIPFISNKVKWRDNLIKIRKMSVLQPV